MTQKEKSEYYPKTKEEFEAYIAAMDEANAAFDKPPKREKDVSSESKKTSDFPE